VINPEREMRHVTHECVTGIGRRGRLTRNKGGKARWRKGLGQAHTHRTKVTHGDASTGARIFLAGFENRRELRKFGDLPDRGRSGRSSAARPGLAQRWGHAAFWHEPRKFVGNSRKLAEWSSGVGLSRVPACAPVWGPAPVSRVRRPRICHQTRNARWDITGLGPHALGALTRALPHPAARPRCAGTDSHGPMDPPNRSLIAKR
jgi:hypothetical protein